VVDPEDPNIVYAQSQFGVLSRFNLRTGDVMGIQPEDAAGGAGFRWNWDSPLLISPHSHTRVYFASNRVLRSDDRGDSWRTISPDLTRQIDRNTLKMMDRLWGADAVAKNASTTLYGNIFALAESPIKEGLLFAGTDDGRIQISENGGGSWRAIDRFPGVPETTYVSRVVPSQHDVNTVYATFNNHQTGDFTPYVLKSTDLGRTWTSIAGDLPARGTAWVIAEDHLDRNLLFVGTEFGVYVSREGGNKWVRLKGGLPTIQVRDIAIQKRSNDLVLATFGRGFYILDDYSPLREWKPDVATHAAKVYASRPAYLYAESSPLGLPGNSFQGHGQYLAENPPFGAVITYSLKDGLKSQRARRREADAAALKKNVDSPYPPWDSLKVEDRQEDPAVVVVTVSDSAGRMVRRFTAPATAGLHRVAWDLRLQPTSPVNGPDYQFDPEFPFSAPPPAPFVGAGNLSGGALVPDRRSIQPAWRSDPRLGGVRRPTDGAARGPDHRHAHRTDAHGGAGALGAGHGCPAGRDGGPGGLPEAGHRSDADRGLVAGSAGPGDRGAAQGRAGAAGRGSDPASSERGGAAQPDGTAAERHRQRVERHARGADRRAAGPDRHRARGVRSDPGPGAAARGRGSQGTGIGGGAGRSPLDARSDAAAPDVRRGAAY
jgi:hypothetical protein